MFMRLSSSPFSFLAVALMALSLSLTACDTGSSDEPEPAAGEPDVATDGGANDDGGTAEPDAEPSASPEGEPSASPEGEPSASPEPSAQPEPTPPPPPPTVGLGEMCDAFAQNCEEGLVCGVLSSVCEETCETPGPCNDGADCCPISGLDCEAGLLVNFCRDGLTFPEDGGMATPPAQLGEECDILAQNCAEGLGCNALSGVCQETCETPGPCNGGADCCPQTGLDCQAGLIVHFCDVDGDAGVPPPVDAGMTMMDAGTPADAGTADAGAPDAG